jgi:hypothetical protein
MMNKFIRLTVLTSALLLGSRGVQAQYITPTIRCLIQNIFLLVLRLVWLICGPT